MSMHLRWMLKKRFFFPSTPVFDLVLGHPDPMAFQVGPLLPSLLFHRWAPTAFNKVPEEEFYIYFFLTTNPQMYVCTVNELSQSTGLCSAASVTMWCYTPTCPKKTGDKPLWLWGVWLILSLLCNTVTWCFPHTFLLLLQLTICWLSSKISLLVEKKEVPKNTVSLIKLGVWPGGNGEGMCYTALTCFFSVIAGNSPLGVASLFSN